MRFLLIIDDEAVVRAVRESLERIEGWDAEVVVARTLSAALAAAAEGPFDAALLDLHLSDDGLDEPVARIREAADQLPIVVLTSPDARQAGVEAIRQGAEDLLLEDTLSPDALRRAIRHAIERRAGSLALERSNRAFESFAHTVAHEIRSPLSTVSFACELLDEQQLSAAGVRQLERIRRSVSEVDRIIEGLLEYASATRDTTLEWVDLDELVAGAVDAVSGDDSDEDIIEVGELPTVRAAPSQLRLVFHNLLRNAVQYADPEEPIVRVRAVRRGRAWEIQVEDNGSGILPEDCERVFEMFDRGSSHKGEGTGLGLAICRRVVEGRGGRIEIDTGPLGGCLVRFTLPDEPVDLDAVPGT